MASGIALAMLLAIGLVPSAPATACDLAARFRAGGPDAPPPAARATARPAAAAVEPPGAATGTPPISFVRTDLDPGPYGQVTEGINAGDIDGDGRPDIIEGGDEAIVWYHNPDFAPHLISAGWKYAGGAMVVVRDMDGDGRLDVLTGRFPLGHMDQRETVWFRNTPAGWEQHQLSALSYCHDMAFADLDGDGITDAVCDDQFLDQIVWLRGPADPREAWTTHLIDARSAMGNQIADVDRDGRPDVVAGRAWYRRTDAGGWDRHPFTERVNERDRRFDDYALHSVLDMDGDGRLDVFATLFTDSREGEVWAFFAPPDPRDAWTAVQIDPGPLFGVHSQAAASFDGTSRVQVMVGETNIGGFGFGPNPDPNIYVYRALGDPRDAAAWERVLVDGVGTHEARAVDMDGDGLPDLIGDEENTDTLVPPRDGVVSWWRNTTPVAPPPTSTTAAPPTSTTTTAPGGTSTTTTTLPLGDCHAAASAPAAVGCRLDALRDGVRDAGAAGLGGAALARKLGGAVERAHTLVQGAPSRGRLRKAERSLQRFTTVVERAVRQRRIAPDLGTRLAGLGQSAIAHLRRWRGA